MANAKPTQSLAPDSSFQLTHHLDTLHDAFLFIDDNETILHANVAAATSVGMTKHELLGNTFWQCAPQLVSTAFYQAVVKAAHTRKPLQVEYLSPLTNTWLHVHLSPSSEGIAVFFSEETEPTRPQHASSRNEQMYRDLLESFADGVTIVTPDGLVLDINQRPLADAHLRREEAIGKPFTDLPAWSYDPAVQQQLRAAIARASQGETVRIEARIHPRTDLSLDILMTITSHRNASQQVEYLICASQDITERKQAEDEQRALIDAIPQFVWIARLDGYVTYHNHRLINYLAMTLQQAEGDGWMAGVHPDDRPRVWAAWQTSIQTGVPYEVEMRLQDGTSGAYRWFLVRGVPQRNAQGTTLHWVGTNTDIDEQKRTEQQLKESEENWRVLAETVPQLVWVAQPDGQHEYTNQHWCDYTGFTLEQLQSDRWTQLPFIHPDDREGIRARWQQARDTGAMYEHEGRLRNGQTGEYRWFLTRGTSMRDETGQIIKWFGTCTDIEEQKRAEQRLKESEERFRVLAETVPQLVWTVLPDGSFEYTNQRYRDWTQADFEIRGDNFWRQFVHPEDIERTLMLRHRSLETGEPFENEYRLRNSQTGEYRWFLARGTPVRDEAGQLVKWFGTCTDIDEQKRTEEALRQSQEQVQALMSSNILGIYIAEEEVVVEANETFLHMTGYSREDLQHGRLNRMDMTAPEYIAITRQAREQLALHAYVTPYEKEYIGKDGSRLPVVVGGVATQLNSHQEIIFVLDNSARKELEQRKDDFISMASHELRNPLAAVKLQTQLVRKRLERQSHHEAATALSRMEGPIQQLERLIAELLDVSKMQAGRLEYVQETVDLDALLREITDTMQHTNPSHTIVVRGAVQTSLFGDRDRLGQVFTNLLSNAIKYSPNTETVEIDLSTSEETVTVSVRDHGLGIPREQRDKVFERFYRVTDPKQKAIPGLGMGLYIVAEIVKHHGGTITVDSEVGKGSTFHVALPLKK